MGKRKKVVFMDAKRKRASSPESPESSSTAESKCFVAELPHGLIMDILSRLPIQSLFNCKFVCKPWLRLLSDPHFAKLHVSRSPFTFMISADGSSLKQFLIQIVGVSSKRLEVERMRFARNTNFPDVDFEFVNSVNGLVCLKGKYEGDFYKMIYVCNPLLREYITIPIVNEPRKYRQTFAFGFSSVSSQYKVLHSFYLDKQGPSQCQAEVYTIGTGQWRSIGNAPFRVGFLDINVFLHDSIHWFDYETVEDGFICAFDFGFEQYKRVSLPSFSHKPHKHDCMGRLSPTHLGVLEGCLIITKGVCFIREESEIWVMEEYGVKESWSKKFVVKNLQIDEYDQYEPLFLLSSGEILMAYDWGRITCYDPKLKRVKDITLSKEMKHVAVTAYSPSFVSLQDIAKEEQLKVLSTGPEVAVLCI